MFPLTLRQGREVYGCFFISCFGIKGFDGVLVRKFHGPTSLLLSDRGLPD